MILQGPEKTVRVGEIIAERKYATKLKRSFKTRRGHYKTWTVSARALVNQTDLQPRREPAIRGTHTNIIRAQAGEGIVLLSEALLEDT